MFFQAVLPFSGESRLLHHKTWLYHGNERVRESTYTHMCSKILIIGNLQAHFSSSQSNFDFQKYIERSLDEDFTVMVSIRFLFVSTTFHFYLIRLKKGKSEFYICVLQPYDVVFSCHLHASRCSW